MAASTGTGNYDAVVQSYTANTFATISSGHTVTLTDNVTGCNFFQIEAGATLVGGGFSITVDNDSSNHSFINNGTISGVLDVIITNPNGQSNFDANGQGGNVRNLTVNNAGAVVTLTNDNQTLDGDLTITAGQLTTSDGSTDRNLTVTGDVLLPSGGTLTGNSSTLTFGHITLNGGTLNAPDSSGSLIVTGPPKSGWLFNRTSGTFNHNNGLVHIQAGTNSGHLRIDCYDLKIEMHGSNRVLWRDQSGNEMTVARNLTIVQGGFDRNDLTDALTVTGDVLIEDGGKIGDQNGSGVETGANTFGSLTINSGGIYDATSGTTTITSETTGGFAIDHDGTFTHNNGKVNITTANTSIDIAGTGNLYDLEINGIVKLVSGSYTIDNNVTVASGHTFTTNNLSTSLTVLGNVNVSGSFWRTDNNGTVTLGGLTINSGGEYKATNGTTIMKGALRNVGGTIT